MNATDREAAFQRHLDGTVNYFAAIRAAGDLPWFEDAERLERLEERYPGISRLPAIDARRLFFAGRYSRPAPPVGMQSDPRTPQTYTEERTA